MAISSLPFARGPLSAFLFEHLARPPHSIREWPVPQANYLVDDDLHLALYCCYELHYRGFQEVSEEWEWSPGLLEFRSAMEMAFLGALFVEVGPIEVEPDEVVPRLGEIVRAASGPSLSQFMRDSGDLDQFREFAVHRSAYQLKEADPHTWAIPRLEGQAKAVLVGIQTDEYGGGRRDRMHATLFAHTLAALGLDTDYGAYLDLIPGVTLATVNLVSLFGLHRRWRGALIGHLAIFEMASVIPNSRYSSCLRRLGLGRAARVFYDVHVEADSIHQHLAQCDLAGSFARHSPGQAVDVVFGAQALMALEAKFTRHLLGAWEKEQTSLVAPGLASGTVVAGTGGCRR